MSFAIWARRRLWVRLGDMRFREASGQDRWSVSELKERDCCCSVTCEGRPSQVAGFNLHVAGASWRRGRCRGRAAPDHAFAGEARALRNVLPTRWQPTELLASRRNELAVTLHLIARPLTRHFVPMWIICRRCLNGPGHASAILSSLARRCRGDRAISGARLENLCDDSSELTCPDSHIILDTSRFLWSDAVLHFWTVRI